MATRDSDMSADLGIVERPPPSRILLRNPVVAVLRARHAAQHAPVTSALAAGGVRSSVVAEANRQCLALFSMPGDPVPSSPVPSSPEICGFAQTLRARSKLPATAQRSSDWAGGGWAVRRRK
ncbi:hypothetical protein QFZ79_000954 [Arthrobacter sp. V4I6]|nr:hypothetical protein [Arthrobacter sp. V1I7]MDQ0852843.1 hypothetical protein [Arthrobacter sp. V4I6]